MACRLTQEELDKQFEEFLKESMSDESVEQGSSSKRPSVLDQLGTRPQLRVKKSQASVSWWKENEDRDNTVGKVPTKPYCNSLDRVRHDGNIHLPNQETSHKVDKHKGIKQTAGKSRSLSSKKNSDSEENTSEDDIFTRSSDESPIMSKNSHSSNVADNLSTESHESVSWKSDNEIMLSGKTYCKSLRKSQTIQEVDEDQTKEDGFEDDLREEAFIYSRDSLEPDDLLNMSESAQHAAVLGLHTLNEEDDEKVRFFTSMDRDVECLTKDPRLDKDQESFRELVALTKDHSADEEESLCSVKDNPVSPVYSDDFEDEASVREPEEKKAERHGMLAKVSLHDSLNSTNGASVPGLNSAAAECPDSRFIQAAEQSTTEQPSLQSGTSDVKALQEAYRQISHSHEESEEIEKGYNSSLFSSSTPENLGKTLQHASTAESDLPTAEELMCAIRPDSGLTYDLCLQALREKEVPTKTERLGTVSQLARAKPNDFSVALREVDSESPVLESYETSNHKHKCIAEEVNRLMMEQDGASKMSPIVSYRGKNTQVLGKPTTKASISAASKKSAVQSVRNKRAEIRPLPKASTPSRTSNSAKPPSPSAQPKSQNQTSSRKSSLGQTRILKGPDPSLRISNDLSTSVQSSAFLQQPVEVKSPDCSDSNTQQAKAKGSEPQQEGDAGREHNLLTELSSVERLQLQLAEKERHLALGEMQFQLEHNKEINALKQENYMLRSTLHSIEESSKKQKLNFGDSSNITEAKLKLIEKEMREQETLIQGYHLENEKLYLQMKALQAQTKQNEDAMFAENQRLLSELALTKGQLNTCKVSLQKNVGHVGIAADHGFSIAELQAQGQTAKRRESQLQEETRRLQQEKQALQVDLEVIKKERDVAKAQIIAISGDKGFELKLLEERHKEEEAALKKRLQWYAENQELLDKDSVRLRAANAETQRLTAQVEKLKMEVAKQANQHQKKVKERAGQAKRIQDLERQVKEMEEILRRKHPNSLPALMLAAAVAGGEEGREKSVCVASQPSYTSALLERRILRLEAELEGHDEEAKRSLRAMEQHFHRIKLQYEQKISDLEQQLVDRSPEHQISSSKKLETQSPVLQEELEKLQEAHQLEVRTLKAEVASLQEQLQPVRSSAELEKPSRHQKQAEVAQATRLEHLNQELAVKSRTIQELRRTVERLQRERSTVLSSKVQPCNAPPKRPAKDPVHTETFPSTQDERDYQPRVFSGSHVSELQQENERLRVRQEHLKQQWEEEKVSMQATATQAQAELLRAQEQLALLRTDYEREIKSLMAHHALEHSSSKVAELTNQVKTQEIMVLHLREQLKELQRTKEALAISKLREETLQSQLTKLLEELKQAKEMHSPELRHFASLEHKIHTMELRYNQREQELQQMIAQTRSVVEQEQQAEVARWKKLAQGKSSELEAFRLELDSILDVLRELQKQGVVIPATKHNSDAGCIFRFLRS